MAENKMQLEDWLDDLCVRFIIHLPKEDLSSVARICFQVEEAQWFYEDFIRPLDPTLPSMSLRSFCLRIFQHCPLLAPFSVENHMRAFEEFLQYKTRVPVRGAILLNEAMDSTVLVRGWKKGASWSFPRGKINKDEDDLDCAIREVYEETGFDIRQAGLVPKEDEIKYIQMSMREQQIRLYVFRNVPTDTVFEPKTRKEISKVEWYRLSELPAFRKKGNNSHNSVAAASNANKFYMVAPFLVPLKKWVVQQKKKDAARAAANPSLLATHVGVEEPLTEDDIGAQTEPVAPPSNGTPAIETLEGATRELQRLLKVQPPTQGLQINPSTISKADKGDALMALLRKGPEAPSHQGSAQPQQPDTHIPHTPADLTYTNPPEPNTPHHHHPTQRQPIPNYQPPPSFPIPPNPNQNAPRGYFQQTQQHAQVLPQVYGRNPFVNPAQQQRNEPVLLHPQPLPPQVQQSLLTRGILPTPAVPDMNSQGGSQVQQGGAHPLAARTNDAYAPPRQPGKPTQLTGHAMTLLNAFRSGPREDTVNKPLGNTPHEDTGFSQSSNQHQTQRQPVPWPNVPSAQGSNPAAQYLPHHMAPVAPMRTSPRAVQPPAAQHASKPAQPADSHRSALLEMFKKSGPRSPLSNEFKMQSSMQSSRTQQDDGSAKKVEPGSPAYKATSAANAAMTASEVNGGPTKMNPELNLPYRSFQILSRPKQTERGQSPDAQAQMQRLQQRLNPQEPRNADRQGIPSPRDHALLQQPEQEVKRSPQLNYAAAQAASLPYAQYSPSGTHAVPSFHHQQPTGALHRRKDSNPEQRQKLLSLFSKEPQPLPAGLSAEEKGKAREPPVSEQPRSSTPRSRVASLASAGGNEPAVGSATASRRGSQTPISPADRSFLLSYLESVTSSGR
ncbi:uncharacterized protein B0T15DRAFT_317101 [Chaetomium strumarium]|uniref:Nudix hydrolase domain-containing protein n=1 Tax=Chaetomium strumarium TaxID=1170767 RepID=A0AAJ0GKG0_9PEZI|nr:hypothetical protein B0T15DRAFT_317101 [Chaetomium strumarium]